MIRKAKVYYNRIQAGILTKEGDKYFFRYEDSYIDDTANPQLSLSLPKQKEQFESNVLFPFFYGLLAEGEMKEIQCRKLKIDENDHFTRLIKTAYRDTIGAVTLEEVTE